jgi:preprotein translocase subunit SecE
MFTRAYQQIQEFFKDLKGELKKVTFPGRNETLGSTAVVIVFVLIIGVFLAVIDSVLVKLVSQIIG